MTDFLCINLPSLPSNDWFSVHQFVSLYFNQVTDFSPASSWLFYTSFRLRPLLHPRVFLCPTVCQLDFISVCLFPVFSLSHPNTFPLWFTYLKQNIASILVVTTVLFLPSYYRSLVRLILCFLFVLTHTLNIFLRYSRYLFMMPSHFLFSGLHYFL